MKTVPEPPGNSFEPLGPPIRPEAKPAPTAPVPTENSRIGRRLDGMLETLIPGNEGKVPKSDFAERGTLDLSVQEQAYYTYYFIE